MAACAKAWKGLRWANMLCINLPGLERGMVIRMDKLVSIVVPVFNAGKYIDDTVETVRNQSYRNWELLLVDDCSADDSRGKIEEWCRKDPRIRMIAKEKNQGAAGARNTGMDLAAGRYIAFLDADDFWRPGKLEKQLEFMEKKKAAFSFTAYEFGDEEGRETGKRVAAPPELVYKKALSRTVIFTSTVMFDLEKIKKDMIKMPVVASEDTATWWKVLRSGYTAYGLDEVLTVYRRPEGSLSANKLVAIKRIWNLYRNVEKLPLAYSMWNFAWWAMRATLRRL